MVRVATFAACVLTLCLLLLGVSPAWPAPCGNEGFRASPAGQRLPDCRAYEQVTPLDKDGIDVTGSVPFVKAALGGGAVTFLSSTSSGALQEYTPGLAGRTASTWSSAALLPPLSGGRRAEVVGLTQDLSAAFLRVDEPGERPATALLARAARDGALHTIVPFTAGLEPRFVGASEDGSLVVFESPAALPGSGPAISGEPNLYGWGRSSGQVRLIGIFNDGSAPAEGAFGGSYDWILGTREGTLSEGGATRDYYTQDQHVVSADGARVYFTAAGTGQLYLRRNPSSAQSPLDGEGNCTVAALACTIRVSASRKAAGAGSTGPGPAAFVGAGVDGAKSFFISAEELTDDANTGPDPLPPRISRAGIDGSPAGVEADFLGATATGVAVGGSHLYWANPSRGSIGRAGVDGSGLEEDFVSGLARPQWVAVDDEYLYWTSPGVAGKPGEGTIGRTRLDGGTPEPNFITAAGKPRGIAVNGTHLFWANEDAHSIGRANIDGSGVEPSFHPLSLWEVPQGVALDDSHIYWAVNNPNGFISRSDINGSHEIFRFTGVTDEVRGIALNGKHVYWTAQGSGAIGRANLDLDEAEPRFIPGAGSATGLAIDGPHLYWATGRVASPGNDLYRYDAESGELVDLAPDPGEVNGADVRGVLGISADGSYVYFAANGVLANAPNGHGETPQPGTCQGKLGSASGSCNLYLSHAGRIDFIARLEVDGGAAESDAANWAATPTGIFDQPNFQQTARVSADGRTLLFRSQRQLTGYANEGVPELYRYRVGGSGPACLSCDPSGAPPTGAPTLGTIAPPAPLLSRPAATLTRNLSVSGDRVFFESVDALVGADRNGDDGCPRIGFPAQEFSACQDVYEWQAEGSGSCETATVSDGCLYLLSGGQPGQPGFFADASAGGEDAFLFTGARLLDEDIDDLVDVYDARVNGGLPAQHEAPPDCRGEDCRPAPSTPAEVEVLGTSASGPSPPRAHHPARRCSKAKRAPRRHCGKRRRSHR